MEVISVKLIVFALIVIVWAGVCGWTFGRWKGMLTIGGGFLTLAVIVALISYFYPD